MAPAEKRKGEEHLVLALDNFKAVIERERAKADRNGHGFSLVTFRLGEETADQQARSFPRLLLDKMRITDEIGWLSRRSIGVLLFSADVVGAHRFVNKVQEEMKQEKVPPFSIFTYPDHPKHIEHRVVETAAGEMPDSGSLSNIVSPETTSIISPPLNLRDIFMTRGDIKGGIRGITGKRILDILGASFVLLVISPVMLAAAIAVKLSSSGPIFFRQQRAGLGGRPFGCYKFRSMYVNADAMKEDLWQFNERTGPVFKMENDPRVTAVGQFLRKWSIDELPQLFNVLMGDMSLVGPRPPTMDEVAQYARWHNYRLEVQPGITCIWQVYARHDKCFDNWVRLDIRYKTTRSLWLDLKLLALTLPAVLSRRGAY